MVHDFFREADLHSVGKEIQCYFSTYMFITVFTKALHLTLPTFNPIQSPISHAIYLNPI